MNLSLWAAISREPQCAPCFFLLSVVYVAAVLANICHHGHCRPVSLRLPGLYFLLRNFSVLDICFSSITTPNKVWFFQEERPFPLHGCLTQMFSSTSSRGATSSPSRSWPLTATWPSPSPLALRDRHESGRCLCPHHVASWAGASSIPSCRSPCCSPSPSADPASWTVSTMSTQVLH